MNIENIRHLLVRYYDGTATPDELSALEKYFMDAEHLPSDLRADAALFRSIAKHKKAAVPSDLEQRILNATVASRKRRFSFNRPLIISAAAAVLIIFFVGTLFIDTTTVNAPSQTSVAVNSGREPHGSVSEVPHAGNVSRDSSSTEEGKAPVANAKNKEKYIEPISVTETTEPYIENENTEAGSYREVTDSVEVVKVTTELLATLDAGFGKVKQGVRSTEMAVSIIADPLNSERIRDEFKEQ